MPEVPPMTTTFCAASFPMIVSVNGFKVAVKIALQAGNANAMWFHREFHFESGPHSVPSSGL